ncbi:MAG: signal peptide peptidase SppA [Methanosarcinales archaeon]|nr:MAG: signal peptide peptidase SppA [Methanosarcinales archaeon]
MEHRTKVLACLAIAIVFCAVLVAALVYIGPMKDIRAGKQVAVIYVQGGMITGNVPLGIGYATSENICKNIREATEDASISAIVLRINSPGGTPAAAQEIVTEIKRAQDKGIPVIVSMGDIATSGAYYISAPADVIVANPDTMTGSIGVIWVFTDKSEYYGNEGIEFYTAQSGEFKDMGADWRGLTDEEKQHANDVVMSAYERFVSEIAEGRDMPIYKVRGLSDGRIYTGADARTLGLVDEFGNLYDAIDIAAELGGIEGTPRVKYMNTPTLAKLLFGGEALEGADYARYYLRYLQESPYGRLISST